MTIEIDEMVSNYQKRKTKENDRNIFATKADKNDIEETKLGELIQRWPDHTVAMPTEFMKTALFNQCSDEYVKELLIFSRNEVSLTYTGRLLNKSDQDVLQACLDLCKGKPIGTVVTINYAELAKLAGKTKNLKTNINIEDSLEKLTSGLIDIEFTRNNKEFTTKCLLLEAIRNKTDKIISFNFSPKLTNVLENMTYIPRDARQSLKKTPIARMVYEYAMTQPYNQVFKVEITHLKDYCQSNSNLKEFRRNLKNALKKLENENLFKKESTSFKKDVCGEYVQWIRVKNAQSIKKDSIIPSYS